MCLLCNLQQKERRGHVQFHSFVFGIKWCVFYFLCCVPVQAPPCCAAWSFIVWRCSKHGAGVLQQAHFKVSIRDATTNGAKIVFLRLCVYFSCGSDILRTKSWAIPTRTSSGFLRITRVVYTTAAQHREQHRPVQHQVTSHRLMYAYT